MGVSLERDDDAPDQILKSEDMHRRYSREHRHRRRLPSTDSPTRGGESAVPLVRSPRAKNSQSRLADGSVRDRHRRCAS
jgi:hypothetical protein